MKDNTPSLEQKKYMTVAELILELQYQPQDLEVSVVDYSKKRFKEHRDIKIHMAVPELADPYVQIQLNTELPNK